MTCLTTTLFLFAGNDNPVEWDGVTDVDGNFVSDATVSASLRDSEGAVLSPPVTFGLTYVSGSDGRYRGKLQSSAVTLVAGTEYKLFLTATRAGDDDTHIEIPCLALTRTA